MQFDITVDVGQKRYLMKVERTHAGESIERFKVSAGGRDIELQCNRPELLRTKSTKKIDWKLLQGKFKTKDVVSATFGLYNVMMAIEDHVKRMEPDFHAFQKGRQLEVDKGHVEKPYNYGGTLF